ncbi:TIGR04076 family protein [Chloroflexota bacterium]
MAEQIGYKVVGEIKSIKGHCSAGHKVGDKFTLSKHSCDGLCGSFYACIFPYVIMLQFGGSFPEDWGGKTIEFDCDDRYNAATIELHVED